MTTAARPRRPITPRSALGWLALVLSLLGLAAFPLLASITVAFRETYPITDTWVMPAIGGVLMGAAAVVNALCIWVWRERSLLNIISAAIVIPAGILAVVVVVGGAVTGS